MSFVRRASIIGTAFFALAFTQTATAVTIGFEPPTYSPGSLLGQDGWQLNSYNGQILGGLNGDVVVSTSAPLAGGQSLLYTQTGGAGATDVSKANVVSAVNGGTSAADLTGSVLIQAGPNTNGNGQIGLFLGPDAVNGTSPIGVLVEGGASPTPGVIYVLDATNPGSPFRPVGTYVPNNVFEFAYGVDFDSSSYAVAYRNLTAGDAVFTPVAGGNPDGSFAFVGSFPAEGDGTYSVDVGAFLRDGVGRIDNVSLIPEPGTLGFGLLAVSGLALRRRRDRA